MLLHVVVAGRICLIRLLHIRLVALRRAILVLLGNAVIDGGPYRLRLYLREHALVAGELRDAALFLDNLRVADLFGHVAHVGDFRGRGEHRPDNIVPGDFFHLSLEIWGVCMVNRPVQTGHVVVMVTAGSTPCILGGPGERHEFVDRLLVMDEEIVLLNVSLQQHDGLALRRGRGVHAAEVAVVVNHVRVLQRGGHRLVREGAGTAVIFDCKGREVVLAEQGEGNCAEVLHGHAVRGQGEHLFQLGAGLGIEDLEHMVVLAHTVAGIQGRDVHGFVHFHLLRIERAPVDTKLVVVRYSRVGHRLVRVQMLQGAVVDKGDGGTDKFAFVFLAEPLLAATELFVEAPLFVTPGYLVPEHRGPDIFGLQVMGGGSGLVNGIFPHSIEVVHSGWSLRTN